MVSSLISRLIILSAGTLYPAYRSYKAVRTKDVKEYVRMMMYWICYALFICAEAFADVFVAFWVPFYYELKIAFVFWLLSPYTRGASYLYRKFIHPALNRHEAEIDEYLEAIRKQSVSTGARIVNRGWGYAKEALANVAVKSQAQLVHHLHKSASLNDLSGDGSGPSGTRPAIMGRMVSSKSSGATTGVGSRRVVTEPVIHEEPPGGDYADNSGQGGVYYYEDESSGDPLDLEFEDDQEYIGQQRSRAGRGQRDARNMNGLEPEAEDDNVRVTRQSSRRRQAAQDAARSPLQYGAAGDFDDDEGEDERDILLYGTLPRNGRNSGAVRR